MNFGQIKTRFRRMVGNLGTAQLSEILANEYVNEAIRAIGLEYRFREVRCIKSFPLTVGTSRYLLPSDLHSIRQVWNDTKKYRIVGPYGDRMLADLPVRTNGQPRRYIREGNWIQFDPPPNVADTVKFTYVKAVVDLTDDNAIPLLPADWHVGAAYYARWIYYSDIQDYPKSQSAYNLFELWAGRHPTPIDRETDEADLPAAFDELGHATETRLDFDHAEDWRP